ncbi:A disintegrin and metalloproteinase with thrombospondin motifs 5-like isoform X2 [Saccostrea echinata]|nr:A disintegrin and metalloproteinase with thrombospondin motifs 5-like isoform X2 [Saccostrea echinata]
MDKESIKSVLWASFLIWICSAEDGEFLRKELERKGMTNIKYTKLWHDGNLIRSKRVAGSNLLTDSMKVMFEYSGEKFSLELTKPENILHPSAEIVTLTNSSTLRWKDAHPDCFLTGTVTSHHGIASLSICDKIFGIISTPEYKLHMQSLPVSTSKRYTPIIIAQHEDKVSCSNSATENLTEHNGRSRRSVPSHNITIELAVYTDAAYTQTMLVTDFTERLQHILMKYHAVQMEWSRSGMLGYNTKLVLKKVHFYDTDPASFDPSTTLLGDVLSKFCAATTNDGQFDIRYMHVGLQNLDVLGRAYQNGVCDQQYNCGVDTATGAASFAATAHEIGHLMGMLHDSDRGCSGSDIGVMGGYGTGWSSCSKKDMDTLLQSGSKTCLWEENIPSKDVPANIADITLNPIIPGQMYSPDQICELKYGSGFRFRKYPKLGVCVQYTCANHDYQQSNYGQMFKETTSIYGMYCDTNKICFKMDCVDASTAKLSSLVERQGGWSQWGAWTGCSRTCGRGVNYRRRKCDNPAPINFEGCPGDEYEAEACNKEPCPNDSTDQTTLRNQRAGETCKRLRDNNVIKPDQYLETGSRYSDTADGQCEVTCDPAPGHTIPSFTRFGFMPDGVACVGGSSAWDLNNWPRQSGSYYMCLDGLCQRFGCDDRFNGEVFDECGKCGGDNSSCAVVSKIDNQQQNKGERRTLAFLPEGAFNIQFWFTYADMKKNFLEVYDKTGNVILASMIASSWKFDTRTEPILFAGTEWYYFFFDQFLHAKGPLNESCEIKLFQNEANGNVGVNFMYSESKPVSFDCDFEVDTCGLSLTTFIRDTYTTSAILDPPPRNDFGDYFIYMASQAADKEGTILTSNIAGTSHTQCLAFNYHSTDVNSNITVSWEKKGGGSIREITNPQLNIFMCEAFTISTLETDRILIKGMTKVDNKGAIIMDNLKLFPNSGAFCNSQDACTRDVYLTTLKPEDTTSGSASTTESPEDTSGKLKTIWLIVGITVGCLFVV